jgi:hypothetical protein
MCHERELFFRALAAITRPMIFTRAAAEGDALNSRVTRSFRA